MAITPTIANHLRVPAGSPGLLILRRYLSTADEIFEVALTPGADGRVWALQGVQHASAFRQGWFTMREPLASITVQMPGWDVPVFTPRAAP